MDAFIAASSSENQASISLSQELAQYQQLRKEEKKLRTRVGYLEKQVALKGPLSVEVDTAMLLKEERMELELIRNTLESQQEKIEQLQDVPAAKRTTINAEKLEQLISDVRNKKNQLNILLDNVHFLEEKQAHYGIDVPLHLTNELNLVRKELESVQKQLNNLKTNLKEKWDFDPGEVANFNALNEEEIKKLASQIVQQDNAKKRAEELEQEKYRSIQADKYDALVKDLLEDLKKAVYPNELSTLSRSNNTEWKLLFTGTFGGVHVSLNFDTGNNPVHWICSLYHYNGNLATKREAALSRKDLISAMVALHHKPKRWWQFWNSTPKIPDNWK